MGLAVLHGILAAFWGIGQPLAVLPWYAPMMHGLAALAALGIAFLAFGRYLVLREPAPFWIGVAFGAFALLILFNIVSSPGLLPDQRGLLGQFPNTSLWFGLLFLSALAVFLLPAAFAPWPRVGARGERWWLWLVVAGMVVVVLIAWLSVVFEGFLPLLQEGRVFTALYTGWFYVLLVAYGAGAVLSAHRYRQTGDSLVGYTAITQLVFVFFAVTAIIGGERYDTWWYWRRILAVAGLSVMLFGLLSDYVGLYRRERERARELEALQQEAQEDRNRLRVLIDTAPVGIVLHSAPEGHLELFNRAAELILGRPLAPEVGLSDQPVYYGLHRPSGEPFPPEELPASCALRGESCVGVEMLVRHPDGRRGYLLGNSAPLRDARGHVTGAIVAFQDITPIKEQERLKDEFLSTAAHELKTPVTTIKGYVQMMQKWAPGGHEPREGQAIEVINTQADRINRRVQEMLEAVRSHLAPAELHRVRFDLGELASQVVQRMQAVSPLHRLVLKREGAAVVEADRERVEEVVASLVDNALKYSPQGGEIQVRVWDQEGEAFLSVRDQGVGISRERQRHIFEPFYEPVPPGAPGYRSVVALGLYLSKLAVERHGGRIWFESQEGEGSTFYVSLPLAPLAAVSGAGRG